MPKHSIRICLSLLLIGTGVPHRALADKAVGAPDASPGHAAAPLVLRAGSALVYAPLEIHLSEGAALEPISFAADFWYGVSPALSLGLVHSTYAFTGFHGLGGRNILSGQGAGFCFTGERGCSRVYDNAGLTARYQFAHGWLRLAADGGVFLNSFDAPALALRLGLVASASHGPLSASLSPSVMAGLTAREPDAGAGDVIGNETWTYLPFTVSFAITPQLELMAQKGVAFPIGDVGNTGMSDLWAVPFTVGASFAALPSLVLGGMYSMPVLLGGERYQTAGLAGANGRALTLFVRWESGVQDP